MTWSNFGQVFIRIGRNLQHQNRKPHFIALARFLNNVYRYGIADGTLLMPYGDTWRLHRRIYHQALNTEAVTSYRPMQCTKARQLIINLAEYPQRFSVHFHTSVLLSLLGSSLRHHPFSYSTSIIMSVVYGYDTRPTDDPYVEYAEKGVKAISKATDPKKAALLKIFPFRRFIACMIFRLISSSSPETTYMDARFTQGGSGRGKTLCNWVSPRSFWNGTRANGAYLLLLPTEWFLKFSQASGRGIPSMISDAVKKNESNGNLPEVTLAIRATSSAAYGGTYPRRVYYVGLHFKYFNIAGSETVRIWRWHVAKELTNKI